MTRRRQEGAGRLVLMLSLGALLAQPGMDSARGEDVFALVAQENGSLDKLDITTGLPTLISNNGSPMSGLAFNADESVLYGITSTSLGSPTDLVTVNPSTGQQTLVGHDGVALSTITNLKDGRLFGVDYNDSLYQVNPTTGAATLVGATGLPTGLGNFSNSLASNGTTLYYTLDPGGGKLSSLYTL